MTRLACPTCRREIKWTDEFPHRPFCSERCRLLDLGGWLAERHAIPGDELGEEEIPSSPGPHEE